MSYLLVIIVQGELFMMGSEVWLVGLAGSSWGGAGSLPLPAAAR